MNTKIKLEHYGSLRRYISSFLLVVGLAWIGYLMSGYIDTFADVLPDSWFTFLTSLGLLCLSVALPGIVFWYLLSSSRENRLGKISTWNLYFVAQLLKYIPGKIWGIVYQVSRVDSGISAGAITRVNVDHTIFIMSVNVIFAISVLATINALPFTLAISICLVTATVSGIYFFGGADRLLKFGRGLVPEGKRDLIDAFRKEPLNLWVAIRLILIQIFSMALYTLAWYVLTNAYPRLTEIDFILLGMMYVVASAIGIMTMITPAGLGVREASFVTLSSSFAGVSELAFIAIVARIWFLFAEVITAVLILLILSGLSLNEKDTVEISR